MLVGGLVCLNFNTRELRFFMDEKTESKLNGLLDNLEQSFVPDLTPGNESDYELVVAMGNKLAPGMVEPAFEVFFRRNAPKLLAVARKFEFLGPKFDADFAVGETLNRAYRYADKFTCPANLTADQKDEQVFRWLCQILRNLVNDFCRNKEIRDRVWKVSYMWRPRISLMEQISKYHRQRHYLDSFLKSLPPNDSELLRVSYKYTNEISDICRIPSTEKQALCKRLGISENNLRVRRNRLVARLIEFVNVAEYRIETSSRQRETQTPEIAAPILA